MCDFRNVNISRGYPAPPPESNGAPQWSSPRTGQHDGRNRTRNGGADINAYNPLRLSWLSRGIRGTFRGTNHLNVEEWIAQYERVKAHNKWDATIMLATCDARRRCGMITTRKSLKTGKRASRSSGICSALPPGG